MPKELNGVSEYLASFVGALFFIIVGGIGYTLKRLINITDSHDSRIDMAEKHISTNHRDLQLLREEHARELIECHRKKRSRLSK